MSGNSKGEIESGRDLPKTLFDFPDPFEELEEEESTEDEGSPDDVKSDAQIQSETQKRDFRLILQKVDFLLPQLVEMVKDRTFLDLAPRYQRRFRWKKNRQSLLIESLLLNIPMPSIFLYEYEPAKYEVMDGRQRLTTLSEFMRKDGFKLRGLEELQYLNGLSYDKLPQKLQAALRRASFPVTIILNETDQDANPRLRQLVFERLNTGGQMLSAQEVRNCIYDGHFNEMLVRVARSSLFTSTWEIPPSEPNERTDPSEVLRRDGYFATMQDCEIVLRYFAFSDVTKYSRPKKRLDEFMRSNFDCTEAQAKEFESDYLNSLKLATAIYGDKTFKVLPQFPGAKRDDRRLSAPFSDAVLLACKKFLLNAETLLTNRDTIVSQTEDLMKSKETYDDLIGSKNTKVEFERRIKHLADIFEKNL